MQHHEIRSWLLSSSRGTVLTLRLLSIVFGVSVGLLVLLLFWRVPVLHERLAAWLTRTPLLFWLLLLALLVSGLIAFLWTCISPAPRDEAGLPAGRQPARSPRTAHASAERLHRSALRPPRLVTQETPHASARGASPPSMADPPEEEHAPTTVSPQQTAAEIMTQLSTLAMDPAPSASVAAPPPSLLSITLLKELTLTLHLPDGGSRRIPLGAGTKRARLLAFLAAGRGEPIHRSKILYALFEWRKEDTPTDDDAMGNLLHAHAKLLRNDIKKVVRSINEEAGRQVLDPAIDPFATANEYWRLAPLCRVVDLEAVEAEMARIEVARKEGQLAEQVPASIKAACDRLLAAYPGDFLEEEIRQHPDEFRPWEGKASWAKRYSTHYRSCLLAATWLQGQYEEQQAQACARLIEHVQREGVETAELREKITGVVGHDTWLSRTHPTSATQRKTAALQALRQAMRLHSARASDPFKRYALQACVTPYYPGAPFDEKVSYHPTTERFGDRIAASEQALRRCLKALAFLGNTREATEVYTTYEAQMSALLRTWGLTWEPGPHTRQEWDSVRALTSGHRFSALQHSAELPIDLQE